MLKKYEIFKDSTIVIKGRRKLESIAIQWGTKAFKSQREAKQAHEEEPKHEEYTTKHKWLKKDIRWCQLACFVRTINEVD